MLNHIRMGKLAGWRPTGHHERVCESYMTNFVYYKRGDRDLPYRLSAGSVYRIGKQKTKQVFPFVVLKPTLPQPARTAKQRAFRTQHSTAATNTRRTEHGP